MRARHEALVSFTQLATTLVVWMSGTLVTAGPASYDGNTRSIQLTYTYANLPFYGMTPDQMRELGSIPQPTADQDRKVRQFMLMASAVIFDATRQKAAIKQFNYVDKIKDADVVISLTGDPRWAGWATPGAVEGRPGQIGLYYPVLENATTPDIALAIAHLVSHYLFQLPDEIGDDPSKAACPLRNPEGPGCLMDNFLSGGPRKGFYGKYCGTDHNPAAPLRTSLLRGHLSEESCQVWVDRFLEARSGAAAVPPSTTAVDPLPPNAREPFTGRFRSMVLAAYSHARSDVITSKIGLTRRTLNPTDAELTQTKGFVQKFLSEQLAYFSTDLDFVKPSQTEITAAVDRIAPAILATNVERSTLFSAGMIEDLRGRANRISLSLLRNPPDPAPGALPSPEQEQQFERVTQKVKEELLNFLKSPPQNFTVSDLPGPNTVLPADERFLEAMVRDVVIPRAQPVDTIAGRAAPVATPVTPDAGKILILAPLPFDPKFDEGKDTAGQALPYFIQRQLVVDRLSERIALQPGRAVDAPAEIAPPAPTLVIGLTYFPPIWGLNARITLQGEDRLGSFAKMIDALRAALDAKKVKRVILVVPPGPTPAEALKRINDLPLGVGSTGASAPRLDVLKLGAGLIGTPLLSAASRTGGSIHRIAAVDEIGAVVQSLRHEALLNSAVASIAQKGLIDLSAVDAMLGPPRAAGVPIAGPQRNEGPQPRAARGRQAAKITRLLDTDDLVEIEFDQFQAQENADFEFVLGLSRPLQNFPELAGNPDLAPRLRLYQDGLLTEHLPLDFENLLSRDRSLVFRIPASSFPLESRQPATDSPRLSPAKYVPKLLMHRRFLPKQEGDKQQGADLVDFTFSIAASSPRVQLLVSVRGANGPGDPLEIPSSQPEIVLEAEVFAGAPVLNPEIQGMVERINPSTLAGDTFVYHFRDDGIYPDLLKSDGVSTARITLTPSDRRLLSEYRVWVQASSASNTTFVPLVDPVLRAGRDAKEKELISPTVPAFQRATSLEFHVRGRAVGDK